MTMPVHAGRRLERGVLDVAGLVAEDGLEQLFFGRRLGLALRRDLADQDIARLDLGADADDAVLVEVLGGLFGDVGNFAGELFLAALRVADLELELFDVDGGEDVLLDDPFADDDGVFEVVPVPGHEGDQHVAAEGEFALVRGASVGQDLALLHRVALARRSGF